MKRLLIPIVCGLTIGLSSAFSDAHATSVESPLSDVEKVNFAFRGAKHWKGSDGAMTVRIGDGKILWLFGDTWIKGLGDGASRTMINNSVAIEERPVWTKGSRIYMGMRDTFDRLKILDATWTFWYRGTPDKPESMFKPKEEGTYYWPGCGATNSSDKLFLILKKIRPKKNADPLFAFDWFGEDLVVVSNRDVPPSGWTYKTIPISSERHEVQFGLGCMSDNEYLYSLCYLQETPNAQKKTILARILWADLESAKNWEYFCGSDNAKQTPWNADFHAAKNLFPDGGPEISLFHHNGLGCYVCVYQAPFSNQVIARFSRKVEGPYSAPLVLYDVPPIVLHGGKKALVYAGKAHEHLSTEAQIGFTYCANPGGIEDHKANPGIYFPKAMSKAVGPQDVQKLMDAAEHKW